ncbi:hypothetical protein [uncultured Pantoea sp.]|uniref:hypothetical protein n=1 Tax=uncultured Pantoea sp. TaxID=218084 RepID=UPI002589C25A|nr:hypothetical protein [uncultured Pantoea sp.]
MATFKNKHVLSPAAEIMTRAGEHDAVFTQRNKGLKSAFGRSRGYADRGGGKSARINSSITRTPVTNRMKNNERDRELKRGSLLAGWQAAEKNQLARIMIKPG